MKPKSKLIYSMPFILLRTLRSKMLSKKMYKAGNEERYPIQWRNDYVLKKAKHFLKFLNIKIKVKGYENIPQKTTLMIANHSSSVDAASILVALENRGETLEDVNFMPVFLAKKELKFSKWFSGYMKILHTFFLDRSNFRDALKIMNDLSNHAKKNQKHIVIFPEGTRSKDGQLQEFKAGSFRIAKKFFFPIIPITIKNASTASDLERNKKLEIEIIFHKPIKPLSIMSMQTQDIAKKVKDIIDNSLKTDNKKSLKKR